MITKIININLKISFQFVPTRRISKVFCIRVLRSQINENDKQKRIKVESNLAAKRLMNF